MATPGDSGIGQYHQWALPNITFERDAPKAARPSTLRWRASRFRLPNPSNNSPVCFTGRVPVASGVGGGLGASSANGRREPSGVGRSSEALPQVGVCENHSFQTDVAPSTRQWSRPLYIGRFLGGVVSRRLTLAVAPSKMASGVIIYENKRIREYRSFCMHNCFCYLSRSCLCRFAIDD